MTFSSRLTPQDSFPEQLEELTTDALEILNSKLHRQAGFEYQQDGATELETRFRLEFIAEELDRRENMTGCVSAPDTRTATEVPVPTHLVHA